MSLITKKTAKIFISAELSTNSKSENKTATLRLGLILYSLYEGKSIKVGVSHFDGVERAVFKIDADYETLSTVGKIAFEEFDQKFILYVNKGLQITCYSSDGRKPLSVGNLVKVCKPQANADYFYVNGEYFTINPFVQFNY